jgi:hypothetical protein
MFRPIWPSSGVKICSGGNCFYFAVTPYVVPQMCISVCNMREDFYLNFCMWSFLYRVVTCFVYTLCLVCRACSLLFFVACFILEYLLDWTGFSFIMWFLSLSVVYFLYYLEYRVVGVDVRVVHLQSVSTHLIHIISLQCVQVFSFSFCF